MRAQPLQYLMSGVAHKRALSFDCEWHRPVRAVQGASSLYVLDQHLALRFLTQSGPLAIAALLLRLFGDAVQYLAKGDVSDGIRKLSETWRRVSFGRLEVAINIINFREHILHLQHYRLIFASKNPHLKTHLIRMRIQ